MFVKQPVNNKGFDMEVKVSCPHCRKQLGKSNLSRHIKQVHLEECTDCADCGVSIPNDNLNKHMRTVHKRLDITTTVAKPCTLCQKVFPTFGSLKRHIKTHTGEKPYGCTKCEKAFSSATSLVAHLRIHTGEKPFRCTICTFSCI